MPRKLLENVEGVKRTPQMLQAYVVAEETCFFPDLGVCVIVQQQVCLSIHDMASLEVILKGHC